MKLGRKIAAYIVLIILGVTLIGLGVRAVVDSFWSGMGSSLIVVSVFRLIQMHRLRKDTAYREKMETEIKDERNQFLRNKAWAWAGYLFVLIIAVAVIVLKVLGQELLFQAAAFALCLLLVLYWGAFLILRKKY